MNTSFNKKVVENQQGITPKRKQSSSAGLLT